MAKYTVEVEKAAQKHLQIHHKSGDRGSIKESIRYLKNYPNTLKLVSGSLKN